MRVPFLVPHLGMRTAELLEAPVMLAVVFFAARFVVRRFFLPARDAPCLLVGATALALLLLAEFALRNACRLRLTGESWLEARSSH